MAPLYKRYIPSKASAGIAPAPSAAQVVHAAPAVKQHVVGNGLAENKRKRERSEDEVAERKAKKLRKKGVEPPVEGVLPNQKTKEIAQPVIVLEPKVSEDAGHAVAVGEPKGEFAHITNVKKRHKLEKEARKARKAAEKTVDGNGDGREVAEGEASSGTVGDINDVGEEPGVVQDIMDAEEALQVVKPEKRRKGRRDASVEPDDGQDSVAAVEAVAEDQTALKKTERKKKKNRQRSEEGTEPDVQQSQDAAVDAEGPTASDPAATPLKKRRHRLEAILTQEEGDVEEATAGAGAEPDGEDEHLKKHGTVLTKFQKATSHAQDPSDETTAAAAQPTGEPVILRDLVPLPQPEKAPTPEFKPDYSALPTWLANPTVVSSDDKATFEDLGLDPKTVQHLSGLGFTDALPVQQAIIPLLLPPGAPGASLFPGTEPVLPDLAVSAATGSGKTIAYLLPIIEALKRSGHGTGRVKALVVVPTRELVAQVTAVAESLSKGSGIRVGVATGTGKLREEQEKLVRRSQRHDPEGYATLMATAHRRNYPSGRESEDESDDDNLDELEDADSRQQQRINDAVSGLIDHVPVYTSAVDIVVCTPGRLIEHLNTTLGFTLSYLQWLVLDEADKLLDQQYDGFLETLNDALSRERNLEEQDARETYLRKKGCWDEQRERRVRKVILSATMTRDVSKLTALRLFRPRMVIVRGRDTVADGQAASSALAAGEVEGVKEVGDGFELPPTLVEYCVPVGEGNEKPLFLVKLLEDKILPPADAKKGAVRKALSAGGGDEDDASDSESDADSTSSSELSDSSSDPSSDSDHDDASDAASSTADEPAPELEPAAVHPDRAALFAPRPTRTNVGDGPPTILVFTSSNESAARLSHLLRNLKPEWSPWITTLTKSKPNRNIAGNAKNPSITISTDRSSRGLDLLQGSRSITHVVQYDVPRSLTSYVHRVGRTARAGRSGEAWTLYTHPEAHWFLHEVARAKKVRRAGEVEKVKLLVEDEVVRTRYGEVLESMREEVFGDGDGKGGKKKE
ncbi:hypothetical protein LTR36_003544 [Oleoguttula mirabilis]|uniref:ATP-dependent RNA helicase n=1 Tax=Oleoguttula mirabilis TaxID=1507867 RepID=A0AAV9JJP6_9PEZI|nr:hypothetical protein LTR36_003544 [Oleoguttula mirabilis]